QLFIHYIGWEVRWDEWLPADSSRVRPLGTKTFNAQGLVSFTCSPRENFIVEFALEPGIREIGVDWANAPHRYSESTLANVLIQLQAPPDICALVVAQSVVTNRYPDAVHGI